MKLGVLFQSMLYPAYGRSTRTGDSTTSAGARPHQELKIISQWESALMNSETILDAIDWDLQMPQKPVRSRYALALIEIASSLWTSRQRPLQIPLQISLLVKSPLMVFIGYTPCVVAMNSLIFSP